MSDTRIYQLVRKCARCGEDHSDGIAFKQLLHPVVDADGTVWDWWGECPISGDPILLKMGAASHTPSAPKYYVETSEEATYSDSECQVFHHDRPFDSIDEAKTWAQNNPGENLVIIYECRDNIITPIVETWDAKRMSEWKAWQP